MATIQWKEQAAIDQEILDSTLNSALNSIDNASERARGRYARTIGLQGGTYEQKRQEVIDWENGVSRAYPYIEEEAKERGETEQSVKDRIRANIDKWLDVNRLNPKIEAKAEAGRDRCQAAYEAGDKAGIETARDNTVAGLDGI